MEIFSTLVGVSFRPASAKEIVKALSTGDELFLEHEPSNPYDSNAVKVYSDESFDDEFFIGYLSRESNAETAEHLANVGEYNCEIVSFLNTMKPHLKITLHTDDDEELEENIADDDEDE